MSETLWKTLFDEERAEREKRLREFARSELTINLGNADRVRGTLPNRNLAPLNMAFDDLFDGELSLLHGGTQADLSNEGPGVAFMASSGAPFTVGDLPFSFIDFSGNLAGTGTPLVYDNTGAGTATWGPLDLSLSAAVTGVLSAARGGTGVNNSTRTLTVATNSGTLAFGSAGLTLTYDEGTYTPTYQGATTGGTTTYVTQIGNWWQIGSLMIVTGQVGWSAATGTGNARVSLPVAAAAVSGFGAVRSFNVTFAAGPPEVTIPAIGADYFELRSPASNAAPAAIAVEAAGDILFGVMYAI